MTDYINNIVKKVVSEPIGYKVTHINGETGYWDSNHPVWESGLYEKSKEHFKCEAIYTQEQVERIMLEVAKHCADICRTQNVSNLDLNVIRNSGKFTVQDLATKSCGENLAIGIEKEFKLEKH